MKMMQGALASACWNMSRTRAAPTPTNISTKSEPREAEERHARFAGDGLGQQRLAGARRADQQHALGNAAAEDLILFGRAEELDDFAQFFDGFVDAGHVVERDAEVFLGIHLAAAAAEGHRRAGAAQAAHHEEDKQHATARSAPASARSDRQAAGAFANCRSECFFSSSSCGQRGCPSASGCSCEIDLARLRGFVAGRSRRVTLPVTS